MSAPGLPFVSAERAVGRWKWRAMERFRDWAGSVERDARVLWLMARDSRTPWPARLLAGLVAGYVLSPIQLIPNFIPVFGYLDDVFVVMLGSWLAPRLISVDLMTELRAKAVALSDQPKNWIAAAIVGLIWIGLAAVLAVSIRRLA